MTDPADKSISDTRSNERRGDDWKAEFLRCLTAVDPKDLRISEAVALKDRHLPSVLYRYKSPTNYAFAELESGDAYLSSPDSFNDPFDSALTFAHEDVSETVMRGLAWKGIVGLLTPRPTQKELGEVRAARSPLKALADLVLRRDERMPPKRRRVFADVLMGILDEHGRHLVRQLSEHVQGGLRVCSLSEDPSSVLMWSHYAQQHQGFCIEYPLTMLRGDDPRRLLLYPVVYRADLLDVTPHLSWAAEHKDFNNLIAIVAATQKAIEWAYEKEWRLVHVFGDLIPRNYAMPTPSRVLLGARASGDTEAKVTELAAARGIPVFRMAASQTRFRVDPAVEPIQRDGVAQ